jgi:hypothetical protein
MKKIEKTTTIYQALDGKEFTNYSDCMVYEENTFKRINLKHFIVPIPYGDGGLYTHIAYKVNSENEFNMLMAYLRYNYGDIYGIEEYSGDGWYMATTSDGDWVDVYLLSQVVEDFTHMLSEIAENTLKF